MRVFPAPRRTYTRAPVPWSPNIGRSLALPHGPLCPHHCPGPGKIGASPPSSHSPALTLVPDHSDIHLAPEWLQIVPSSIIGHFGRPRAPVPNANPRPDMGIGNSALTLSPRSCPAGKVTPCPPGFAIPEHPPAHPCVLPSPESQLHLRDLLPGLNSANRPSPVGVPHPPALANTSPSDHQPPSASSCLTLPLLPTSLHLVLGFGGYSILVLWGHSWFCSGDGMALGLKPRPPAHIAVLKPRSHLSTFEALSLSPEQKSPRNWSVGRGALQLIFSQPTPVQV